MIKDSEKTLLRFKKKKKKGLLEADHMKQMYRCDQRPGF